MSDSSSSPSKLPLKPIPGDYGIPFFGPIKDRLDYFYGQGRDEFFRSKIEKYHSTVFKTNMPPGPFNAKDPRVIAVLDALSFPILFDVSKVEKRNVFTGTYFPSVNFTGGHRVCAYLDPSEAKHTSLKTLFLSVLASKHDTFIPLFRSYLTQLFVDIEDQIATKKEAAFNDLINPMSFNFVFHLFTNKDPAKTKMGTNASSNVDKWLLLQLAPIATLGLPKILSLVEDLVLHTFPLPSFLVKCYYKKVYNGFYENAGTILDKAESFGINREEACHNLVFLSGFNTYGGMKVVFPSMFRWVGTAGEELHRQLADEIRAAVKEEGGITYQALEKMTLTKSAVWETMRIDPPVPFQYGKAKENIVIQSHDAAFEIKKGEMIFGYQPFATKDGKIFHNPEEFVADRFVGEGEKLLKYVYWSNGRETEDPTAENKQCPAKDMVVLLARLMLVELFLRYDTFTVEVGSLPFGPSVTITSLTKATGL